MMTVMNLVMISMINTKLNGIKKKIINNNENTKT